MKTTVFSTRSYDQQFFSEANRQAGHKLLFFEPRLTEHTCMLAFEQGQPPPGLITTEMVRG
jgi:D-lactate dehydrogenase